MLDNVANGAKRVCTTLVTAVVLFSARAAMAADHADDFNGLYDQLIGWTGGSLGKSIALVFLLVGLGMGAVRGSIMGAVTCIAAAVSLVIAPDVIGAIFS